MGRWIGFFVAVAIGIAAGLFYGWQLNPVKYVDTTPSSLRVDYKSDYVLMVAEAYRNEGDMALAVKRLALLGNDPPSELVRQAIDFASGQGWADTDLDLMRSLLTGLENWIPGLETPLP